MYVVNAHAPTSILGQALQLILVLMDVSSQFKHRIALFKTHV